MPQTPVQPVQLTRPLILVGCGKMGGALLEGWLARNIAAGGVIIIDPASPKPSLLAQAGGTTIQHHPQISDIADSCQPQVVVLAVKPQQMDAMLPALQRFVGPVAGPDCLFLSIAAGKTCQYFQAQLGANAAIIRAMPNTPAAIGQGITALSATSQCSSQQCQIAEALMAAVGEVVWLEEESQMDAVTALSGGGPAYVFHMIEAMTSAGVAAGLAPELAARLALVTVAGAGQLALASDEPPARLRENVTSPGGTTMEALAILMQNNHLTNLMEQAIAAATAKSRLLSQ